jgi:exopolysaccharide production protein ExoQ
MRPNAWLRAARGPVAPRRAAVAGVRPAARDRRFAQLLTLMLWVQIGYMVLDISAGDVHGAMQANPVYRLIKLALLACGALVMASRMQLMRLTLRELNRFFLLFVVLASLSIVWSIDPSVTATRLVSLASMVVVAVAFAIGAWHPHRFQEVVRPAITILLLASLIAGIADPSLVKEVGDTISVKNAWRGLTWQKNVFGELGSFGVILWFHAWLSRETGAARALFGGGMAAACLYLSRSSTSLICTVLAIPFMLLLMRAGPATRRYTPYIVAAFVTLCALYGLAVMQIVPGIERLLLDPITRLTGKNLTFSDRTEIWQIVSANIAQHRLLGSGFAAYWGAGPVPSSPSYVFLGAMYFWPTESHNGYLEITNDLGFVGLALLFGYILAYLRQCLRLFRIDRAQATLFLALLFQQGFLNLSESTWLDIDNFCFTIMTVATVLIARALLESRRGGYAPAGASRTLALRARPFRLLSPAQHQQDFPYKK